MNFNISCALYDLKLSRKSEKYSLQNAEHNYDFRGELEFKLTAEFSGFLLEVFVDLLAGVKIRTPSSQNRDLSWRGTRMNLKQLCSH